MIDEIKTAIEEIGSSFQAYKKTSDARIDALVKVANTNLEEARADLDALTARVETFEGRRGVPGKAGATPGDFATKVAGDPRFKELAAGRVSNVKIETQATLRALLAAKADLFSTQAGGSPNEGFAVQAQRLSQIYNDPRRRLSLLDVLTHIKADSNAVEFVRLGASYSPNAAAQSTEGALKAEASIPTTLETAQIGTYANWISVSRQLLSDVPQLRQYIGGLLAHAVLLALESDIITGGGPITGIVDSATSFSPTVGTAADSIGEARSELLAAGWQPDIVLLSPSSEFAIMSERSSDSGVYQGASKVWRDGTIWNLTPIVTPTMNDGDAIVMDTSQHALFDREQVNVVSGYVDDGLVRNMVTLLVEGRWSAASLSPSSALKFTLPGGE